MRDASRLGPADRATRSWPSFYVTPAKQPRPVSAPQPPLRIAAVSWPLHAGLVDFPHEQRNVREKRVADETQILHGNRRWRSIFSLFAPKRALHNASSKTGGPMNKLQT